MKKYIFLAIIIALILAGCSVNEINPRPQDYAF